MPKAPPNVTDLLIAWSGGNKEALDHLIPLVHDELRRQASRYLRRERAGHTLQTTALIHEAYLRLVGQNDVRFENRAYFFGVAARLMRQILVDHARTRGRAKRGGSEVRGSLTQANAVAKGRDVHLMVLDEALNRLAELDLQPSPDVEIRVFGRRNGAG